MSYTSSRCAARLSALKFRFRFRWLQSFFNTKIEEEARADGAPVGWPAHANNGVDLDILALLSITPEQNNNKRRQDAFSSGPLPEPTPRHHKHAAPEVVPPDVSLVRWWTTDVTQEDLDSVSVSGAKVRNFAVDGYSRLIQRRTERVRGDTVCLPLGFVQWARSNNE